MTLFSEDYLPSVVNINSIDWLTQLKLENCKITKPGPFLQAELEYQYKVQMYTLINTDPFQKGDLCHFGEQSWNPFFL